MTEQQAVRSIRESDRRGSERLLLDVPLVVRGTTAEKAPFQEETFTVSVSAHGALVVLATPVELGQPVFLVNLQTQEEREGRVARFGSLYGGLAQVGIEFAQPAPEFWRVDAPPRSWKSVQT